MPVPAPPFASEPASCSSIHGSIPRLLEPPVAAPARELAVPAAAAASALALMPQHARAPGALDCSRLPLPGEEGEAAGIEAAAATTACNVVARAAGPAAAAPTAEVLLGGSAAVTAQLSDGCTPEAVDASSSSASSSSGSSVSASCSSAAEKKGPAEDCKAPQQPDPQGEAGREDNEQPQQRQRQQQEQQLVLQQQLQQQHPEPRKGRSGSLGSPLGKRQQHDWAGPPPDPTRPLAVASVAAAAAAAGVSGGEDTESPMAAAAYCSSQPLSATELSVPEPPPGIAALAAAASPNMEEAHLLQQRGLAEAAASPSRHSWSNAGVHAAAAAAAAAARASSWAASSPEGGKSTTDTRSPASPCSSNGRCCCTALPSDGPVYKCCPQQQRAGGQLPAALLLLQLQSYFVSLLQYLRDLTLAAAAIKRTATAEAAAKISEANYAHHLQVLLGSSCATLQPSSKPSAPLKQQQLQQQVAMQQQSSASAVQAAKGTGEAAAAADATAWAAAESAAEAAESAAAVQQKEACGPAGSTATPASDRQGQLKVEQQQQQQYEQKASGSCGSNVAHPGHEPSDATTAAVEASAQEDLQQQLQQEQQQQHNSQHQQLREAADQTCGLREEQEAAACSCVGVEASAANAKKPQQTAPTPSAAAAARVTAAAAGGLESSSSSNRKQMSSVHGFSWACAAARLGCPDVEALPPSLSPYVCVFSPLLLRGPTADSAEIAAIAAEATEKLTLLRLQQQQEGRQQEAELLLQLQQAHNEFLVLQQQQQELQHLREQLAKHEAAKGTVSFAGPSSSSSSSAAAAAAKPKCAHTFVSPIEEDAVVLPVAAAAAGSTNEPAAPAAEAAQNTPNGSAGGALLQEKQRQQQLSSGSSGSGACLVASPATAAAEGSGGGPEEAGFASATAFAGDPAGGLLQEANGGHTPEVAEAPSLQRPSQKVVVLPVSAGVLAAADFCVDAAGALIDDQSDASPRYCHAAEHGCSRSGGGGPPLAEGGATAARAEAGAAAAGGPGTAPGGPSSLAAANPAVECGSHWGLRRCSRRARALQQSRALRSAAADEAAAAAEDEGLGSEGSTDSAAGPPRRGGRQQQHRAKGYYPGGVAGAAAAASSYCASKKRSEGLGGSAALNAFAAVGSKQRRDQQQQFYVAPHAAAASSAGTASGALSSCSSTHASLVGYGQVERAARVKRPPAPRPRGGAAGAFSPEEADCVPRKRAAAAAAAAGATAASASECLLAIGSDAGGGTAGHLVSAGAPSVSGSESGRASSEALRRLPGVPGSIDGPLGFGLSGGRRQPPLPSPQEEGSRALPNYEGGPSFGSLEGPLGSPPGGASSPLESAAGLVGSAACQPAIAGGGPRGGVVVHAGGSCSEGLSAGGGGAGSRLEALSEDLNEEMRPMKGVYFDRTQKSWIGSFYEERRQIKKRFKVATYGYHTAKALAINVRLGFERKARMRGDDTKDSHPAAHAERLLAGATEAALAAGEAGIDSNKEAQLRLLLHSAESGSTAHLPRSELLQQILRRQPKTYEEKKQSHCLVAAAAAASTTASLLTPRPPSESQRTLGPLPSAVGLTPQPHRWPSDPSLTAKGEKPAVFLKLERQQQVLRHKPRSSCSSSALDDSKTLDATAAAAAAAAAATPCSAVAAAEFAAAVAALRCSLAPHEESSAARGGAGQLAAHQQQQQQQQLRHNSAAAAASESGDNDSEAAGEEDLDEAFQAAIRESRDPTSLFAQALDVSSNSLAFLHPPAALQQKQQQHEAPQGCARGAVGGSKQQQIGRRAAAVTLNPGSCPSTAAGTSTPLDSPTSNAATPPRSKAAAAAAAAAVPRHLRLPDGRQQGEEAPVETSEAFGGEPWGQQPAAAAAAVAREAEPLTAWRSSGCEAETVDGASDPAAKGGAGPLCGHTNQSAGGPRWEEEGPPLGRPPGRKSCPQPRAGAASWKRDVSSSRAAADAKKLQEQQQRLAGLAAATAALSQAHGLGDTAHLQKQLLQQLQELQRQQEQLQPQLCSGDAALACSKETRAPASPAGTAEDEAQLSHKRSCSPKGPQQQLFMNSTSQQQQQQLHGLQQQLLHNQGHEGNSRRSAEGLSPLSAHEHQQQQQQGFRDRQGASFAAAEIMKGLLHANSQTGRTAHWQRPPEAASAPAAMATAAAAAAAEGSSIAQDEGSWPPRTAAQEGLAELSSAAPPRAEEPRPESWRAADVWGAAAAVP